MKETVNCGFWVSISFKKLGLKSFTEYQHSKLIILIICSDPNSISHKLNKTKPKKFRPKPKKDTHKIKETRRQKIHNNKSKNEDFVTERDTCT